MNENIQFIRNIKKEIVEILDTEFYSIEKDLAVNIFLHDFDLIVRKIQESLDGIVFWHFFSNDIVDIAQKYINILDGVKYRINYSSKDYVSYILFDLEMVVLSK